MPAPKKTIKKTSVPQNKDLIAALEQYFGFSEFKGTQEQAIVSLLSGRDTFVIMPTGGGKSLCYQLPAMMLEGCAIVVSPLIALMKNQVDLVRGYSEHDEVAHFLNSSLNKGQVKVVKEDLLSGKTKLLYVAPETLTKQENLDFFSDLNVSFFAVDEAHCISEWGHDFRPEYRRLKEMMEEIKSSAPIIALTATATPKVQSDIVKNLALKNPEILISSFNRENLYYEVQPKIKKDQTVKSIVKYITKHKKKSGIIYTLNRKTTEELADHLKANNIKAVAYHAGLDQKLRADRQDQFLNEDVQVIVATIAFGMGIDKPDIRFVIHYNIPKSIENYYQEAGRAGRDGKRAYAVMLYNHREVADMQLQSDIRYPDKATIKQVYIAIMNHLQVAAGSGEGNSFDFDMASFSAAFKINMLTATYAIKTLEQEEILWFNEVFFKPSTLVFNSNRGQLEDFEKQFPSFEKLIKGLLRSYEGIFDYPATIYETELARFIKKSTEEVKKELKQLQHYGIVTYDAQKDTPQLSLRINRMYADSFIINLDNYNERKNNFETRVKAITEFITNTIKCRSQIIGNYFNDHAIKRCGICDNCINLKSLRMSKEEFEKIALYILEWSEQHSGEMKELIESGKPFKKEKICKVLDYLQSEKKIAVSREGKISLATR